MVAELPIGAPCFPRVKHTLPRVREQARDVRRELRTKVLYEFCESCDGYHIKADPDNHLIDKLNRRILEYVAVGYRLQEIATREDVNLTHKAVEQRIIRLEKTLGALSLPHLIVTAMYLGLIKPQKNLPGIKENHA